MFLFSDNAPILYIKFIYYFTLPYITICQLKKLALVKYGLSNVLLVYFYKFGLSVVLLQNSTKILYIVYVSK